MSQVSLRNRVEDIPRMSAQELKASLSPMLDEISEVGVEKTLEKTPDLLSKIIGRLVEIDAAKYFSEEPDVSDKLMDLFWDGVSSQALDSEELRSALEKTTREIHVNLEASDSPLKGHFIVSRGKLSGGSGMLHFKDEDYRFMGPTEVLLQLLNGELALGFSNLSLQTAGHSGFASLLGPVIRGISSSIKGGK